jgi:transposase-like protein
MKIIPKSNPKCPSCNIYAKKKGVRKTKERIIQRYYCNLCKKSFTNQPSFQKSKTYPLKTILESISNYNLGQSLRAITKTNQIPKSTIHNWINHLKKDLPFNRLRNNIKQNPIVKQQFIHHKQPFLYQYHILKLEFVQKFPSLIQYLKDLPTSLPSFDNTQRISQISKKTPTTCRDEAGDAPFGVPSRPKAVEANVVVGVSKEYNISQKQNYATKLAEIALQITSNNKERHNIIENFMLINDTATIAVEIPVYLKAQNLTGHIDILQIRFHKIYLLDFKPEPINESQAINQLILYRKALSQLTNIPEYKFNLAFFNEKGYYEF